MVTKLLEPGVALLLDAFLNVQRANLLLLLFEGLLVLIDLSELTHDRFTTVERQAVGAGVANLGRVAMTDASTGRPHLLH